MTWPEVRLGRTTFANPILAASGTFGFGLKFRPVANRLGGVVTKGITLTPRSGNPPPRIVEFAGGILNSVGLENPGLVEYCATVLPRMRRLKCRTVVNAAGFSVDEYVRLAERLDSERVDAIELNVSCPNVRQGGCAFGQDARTVARITRAVRARTKRTLIVKLTANFVDPAETARAAEAAGADAVTVINTVHGLALDEAGRPFLGGRSGGLSGPALKPFALYCVDRVAAVVKIPIVGCGGIMNGQDAADFLSAGARMVQVGTASLRDPDAPLRVWRELAGWCRKHGIGDWRRLVGRTRRHG